jgi:hypothetical protein
LTTLVTATGNGTFDINPAVAIGHKTMRLQLLAGGTGAGSGRRGAAGTVRCAGGPGANGAFVDVMVTIADVLALFPTGLVPYNVGPGTAGGAAVTADDTNGNAGTAPTQAVNGTWLGAARGLAGCIANAQVPLTAGSGGTNASGTAGVANVGTVPLASAQNASTTGGPGAGAPGGTAGPGGGITSADVPGAGGNGSAPVFSPGLSGTGGVVGGASPGSGTLGPLVGPGAPPGGGAASITAAAQAGANALANSGAGGGSGGASLNGFASGKGGDGGSGFLRITTMG